MTALSLFLPNLSPNPHLVTLCNLFLLYMRPYEVFALLKKIAVDFFPHYYTPGEYGVKVDSVVFGKILKENNKELYKHVKAVGVGMKSVTSLWFPSFFLSSLPFQTYTHILDIVFNEGRTTTFLFVVGFTIFHLLAPLILKSDEKEEIIEMLKQPKLDYSLFIKEASKFTNIISVKRIQTLRSNNVMKVVMKSYKVRSKWNS